MNDQPTITNDTAPTGLEIAVIGMAGRFPGAPNIDQFWENIKNGVESIGFFSDEELIENGVAPGLIKAPNYVKAKGFLEDIEYFDAFFFDYLPGEAELMDPQSRVFLECAWEALESAGYIPDEYKGLIGIYAGSSFNIEWMGKLLADRGKNPARSEALIMNLREYFSPRVSYKFNLRGPSINVITACSTSLTAVHLACQGLLNGECNMALAGAATISLPKKNGYLYTEGMIASPDGHCRAFDAAAGGTVFGNGVGVVVLKNLEDAEQANDTIYAVIKGSAVNNDGTQKIGFTAPGLRGQVEVIKSAHYMAEVEPGSLSYVEAHGTGTKLGDSIEFEALTQAFNSSNKKSCLLGSVKTNVGHLETAAGVTGLIKTILALKYKLIPPTLHFHSPNPEINFDNSPFYINTSLTPWETDRLPRRAGVNSFGIGGANAYVILEEFDDSPAGDVTASTALSAPRTFKLLTFSARTQVALEKMAANFRQYLLENPGVNLDDAAYTLHVGRKAFEYRAAVVCSDREDALAKLEKITVEICRLDIKIKINKGAAEQITRVPVLEGPALASLLTDIGKLWLKGMKIDWEKFHGSEARRRIHLPTYPFTRQYYWLEDNETCLSPKDPAKDPKQGKKTRPTLQTPYIAPTGKLEENLATMWQDFFGIEQVGVADNFFELRGDSLKAMILISTITHTLNLKISIQRFFANPTIRGIVECAEAIQVGDLTTIEAAEKREYYPLSPGQEGLYIFQMMHPGALAYNENFAVVLNGELDREKLQKAFNRLTQRHESLRTSFITLYDEPFQVIHENTGFALEYYGADDGNEDQEIIKQFVRPFDLSRSPLFRAGLVKLAKQKHVLMLDIHHIITDGTSQQLIVKEFLDLYAGKELPPLQFQYKDFSQWQNRDSFKAALKKQEEYWLGIFEKKVPLLKL
ncbi:MAG: condensation domain-containing protein, partial [Acidobacteria bacterium]|nr:condensation domain-containing protein [Acidobacteriota bacterium]